MWNAVRRFNGIMILLRLLETRSPISDADAIRELACKALLGLSRDEAVNQMLVMLPLFAKGTLQCELLVIFFICLLWYED